jgi:hypothetical protein
MVIDSLGILLEEILIPLGVIYNAIEHAEGGRQFGSRFRKVVAVGH